MKEYRKKSGYKFMTENEFIRIKTLLRENLTATDINRLTGRHSGTIYRIKSAKDWADYQKLTSEMNVKFKEKQLNQMAETKTPEVRPESPVVHNEIVESLNRIEKTLARLVQAWENPPRRRLF